MARKAPLSIGFSRQEHWSGLPFPSPATSHTVKDIKGNKNNDKPRLQGAHHLGGNTNKHGFPSGSVIKALPANAGATGDSG